MVVKGAPDLEVVVLDDWIGNAKILDRFLHVVWVFLELELWGVDADYCEPKRSVFGVPSLEVGESSNAVDAGIGPEVDQDNFVFLLKTGKGEGVAVKPLTSPANFRGRRVGSIKKFGFEVVHWVSLLFKLVNLGLYEGRVFKTGKTRAIFWETVENIGLEAAIEAGIEGECG